MGVGPTTPASAAAAGGTRFPTVVGFVAGFLSFLAEFLVALASSSVSVLVPLAYLAFGVYALIWMAYAPSRPFQRGLGPGLAVAVLMWITLFDTYALDQVIFVGIAIAGWAAGLELSRRRGRLPPELPPTGRRRPPSSRQPGSTRRQ